MTKTFLKNQNIPTKPCPRCGVGKVYVGERSKSLNVKINGVSVCEDCMVKHIKEITDPSTKDLTICIDCGEDVGNGAPHWEQCPVLGRTD